MIKVIRKETTGTQEDLDEFAAECEMALQSGGRLYAMSMEVKGFHEIYYCVLDTPNVSDLDEESAPSVN